MFYILLMDDLLNSCFLSGFQELTEEGLPFVILFHHPDDVTTPSAFKNRVQQEAAHEKGKDIKLELVCHWINFTLLNRLDLFWVFCLILVADFNCGELIEREKIIDILAALVASLLIY